MQSESSFPYKLKVDSPVRRLRHQQRPDTMHLDAKLLLTSVPRERARDVPYTQGIPTPSRSTIDVLTHRRCSASGRFQGHPWLVGSSHALLTRRRRGARAIRSSSPTYAQILHHLVPQMRAKKYRTYPGTTDIVRRYMSAFCAERVGVTNTWSLRPELRSLRRERPQHGASRARMGAVVRGYASTSSVLPVNSQLTVSTR